MNDHKEKQISGIAEEFTVNKHEDIDGIIINADGKKSNFKFPPHTAAHTMVQVKAGDTVDLVYQHADKKAGKEKKPHPENGLKLIRNTVSGFSVDVNDFPAPKPAENDEISAFFAGDYALSTGKKDEITGIKFDGKYIHLKPHLADPIRNELIKTLPLRITAKKRLENAGFIHVNALSVYHAVDVEVAQPVVS